MPLKIVIPECDDLWDERAQRFISSKETVITLEHSLVSISKWEAKWKRAFLSKQPLTYEQILDYIERCMLIGGNNIDPMAIKALPAFPDKIKQIKEYMEDSMTATVFNNYQSAQQSYKNRCVTSEELYYYMASNNIPIEFQKWHLNRLLALLKVFEVKNAPPKKTSKKELMSNYAAINKANRARFGTKG